MTYHELIHVLALVAKGSYLLLADVDDTADAAASSVDVLVAAASSVDVLVAAASQEPLFYQPIYSFVRNLCLWI